MSIRAVIQNPWRIWDPPVFPRTPQNNSSHSILPLKVMICSQKFIGNLESNTIMIDKIDSANYQEILNKANEPLKSPILWYVGIKCFLTFVSFIASVAFIISLIFLSFLWAGISGIVVVTSFFCIRESGNQYYKTMQKLQLIVNSILEEQQKRFLGETDVRVFSGDFCAWLDFTTAGQAVVEEPQIKTFHIFTPGSIKSKGTASLPLI